MEFFNDPKPKLSSVNESIPTTHRTRASMPYFNVTLSEYQRSFHQSSSNDDGHRSPRFLESIARNPFCFSIETPMSAALNQTKSEQWGPHTFSPVMFYLEEIKLKSMTDVETLLKQDPAIERRKKKKPAKKSKVSKVWSTSFASSSTESEFLVRTLSSASLSWSPSSLLSCESSEGCRLSIITPLRIDLLWLKSSILFIQEPRSKESKKTTNS